MGLIHDLIAAGITAKDIAKAVEKNPTLNAGKTGQVFTDKSIRPVLVKVTSAASGGGKYNGRIVSLLTLNQVTATGTLAETDLGDVPTADNCLVLNSAEVAKATHDLTGGTPIAKVFIGILQPGRSSTDRPVVVINGYDWEACT